jgi:hypothetical protein
MLSTPEINALRLRRTKERITHDLELAMRLQMAEPGMGEPADWAAEHHRSPASLLRMTAAKGK